LAWALTHRPACTHSLPGRELDHRERVWRRRHGPAMIFFIRLFPTTLFVVFVNRDIVTNPVLLVTNCVMVLKVSANVFFFVICTVL
jgi:hypothetical protein